MSHLSKAISPFSGSATKAAVCHLMSAWDIQTGWRPSQIPHDLIAARLLQQHNRETRKLAQRITQNMFDEMENHKDGHRRLEMLRLQKQPSALLRSISQPLQA